MTFTAPMTFAADVVIGMDIGTTSAKAVARSATHGSAAYVEQPTPWQTGGCGQTEIDPYRLLGVAVELIGRAAAARLLARLGQPGLPVERIQVPARIIARGSGELRP